MSLPDKNSSNIKHSTQEAINKSLDDKFGVMAVELVAENSAGTALERISIHGDKPLTSRLDDTGTFIYTGEAQPGSATSSAVWRISRVTSADSTVLWADGDAEFNNVWDDRASGSYS